ncbi:MAG: hypothetical protein Q8K93_18650 [Reyranella sp.]|nr:hypothetical protein [Reyranella sp.]
MFGERRCMARIAVDHVTKLLQRCESFFKPGGDGQDPEILGHGGLEPATAMQRPGKLEGRSIAMGCDGDHALPDVDGLLEAASAHQESAEPNQRRRPLGLTRQDLAIDCLGGGCTAGAFVALGEQDRPFPDIEDVAKHHHHVDRWAV